MRMHANYGGLLNRKLAKEDDQQDTPFVDTTSAETEVPSVDEPVVATDVTTDTSAVEDGVAVGDQVAADTTVDAAISADPAVDTMADDIAVADVSVDAAVAATVDPTEAAPLEDAAVAEEPAVVAEEPAADPVLDTVAEVPAEETTVSVDTTVDTPVEDVEAAAAGEEAAVPEAPVMDAETEAAVDEATAAATDAPADVSTELESDVVVDTGTTEGTEAAEEASAAAQVEDGVDATGDTTSVTDNAVEDAVVETTDTANAEETAVVAEEPAATTEETPTGEETTIADTAVVTEPEAAAEEPVVDAPAEETPTLDPLAETTDMGTAEGGETGEAGLTEDAAVNDGETEEVGSIDTLLEPEVTEQDSDIDGVNAIDADVTDMNDELDTVTDAAQDLEIAVESLRIAADNGGLDRNGGMFANLHIQSIYARIPSMDPKSQRMSMEAFGGVTMSKVDGTQLAMEEAKSNLRKILDQVIEMIKQGAQFIKEAFAKYFDEATALYHGAKSLKEKAFKTSGNPTVDSFVDNQLARAIFVPGQSNISAVQSATILSNVTGQVMDCVESGLKQADAISSVIKGSESADKLASKVISMAMRGDKVSAETVGAATAHDGMVVCRGRSLPGNRAVVGIYPASNSAPVDVVASTKTRVLSFDTSLSAPEGAKLEALSKTDVGLIAGSVMHVLSLVIAFKKKMSSIDSIKTELVASVRKVSEAENARAVEAGSKDSTPVSTTDAVALAKCAAGLIDQPASSFVPYALTTCRALLHYGQKSLAAHGATAKA